MRHETSLGLSRKQNKTKKASSEWKQCKKCTTTLMIQKQKQHEGLDYWCSLKLCKIVNCNLPFCVKSCARQVTERKKKTAARLVISSVSNEYGEQIHSKLIALVYRPQTQADMQLF